MKILSRTVGAALGLMAFCFISAASAVPLMCKEAAADQAFLHASEIRSCLAADLTGVSERIFSVDATRNELSIAVESVGSDKLDHFFSQGLKYYRSRLDGWSEDRIAGRGRFDNRTLELASISRSLKGLAKELNVPIVVLSQLSRAPEARSRPN